MAHQIYIFKNMYWKEVGLKRCRKTKRSQPVQNQPLFLLPYYSSFLLFHASFFLVYKNTPVSSIWRKVPVDSSSLPFLLKLNFFKKQFIFTFFFLFRATPMAYGSSQPRGLIGTADAGLRHSHSSMGSSHTCGLNHISWQHRILNLLSGARDGPRILMYTSHVCYHWVATGTPIFTFLFTVHSSICCSLAKVIKKILGIMGIFHYFISLFIFLDPSLAFIWFVNDVDFLGSLLLRCPR